MLDTNIIIDHLRSKEKAETLLMTIARKVVKENLALSIVSIQELYEGQSTKEEEKERYLLATIAPLTVLSYTYEIAKLAGEIARDIKKPIEFADAAIAATAIVYGAELATLNKRDFEEVEELALLPLP